MKTIIIVLILLTFLQTSLTLNLGLILILSRAFIRQDKVNFYLAFVFGLLTSQLLNLPFGLLSLLYMAFVEVIYLWSKTPFSRNIFLIVPVAGLILLGMEFLIGSISPKIFIEMILIFPIYLLVRFWEERFIAPKDIKLRI